MDKELNVTKPEQRDQTAACERAQDHVQHDRLQSVIAELADEIEKQERQPAVEKRQSAQEQRAVFIEHIAGHPGQFSPAELNEEIQAPQRLWNQDPDGGHRDQ